MKLPIIGYITENEGDIPMPVCSLLDYIPHEYLSNPKFRPVGYEPYKKLQARRKHDSDQRIG